MKHLGRTGERVIEPGVYKNKYGKQVTLEANATFPACPDKGSPTEWVKTE